MKEEGKESNNRGNIILLTVIAIATMIIVLVGATFAYLASSIQDEDIANIEAVTSAGSDMLLMNAGEDIEINANITNFYEGAGNLDDSIDASVTLQTTSTTPITYNYNVYLDITSNDFEYSSGMCYVKPSSVYTAGTSYETCKEGNSTNIWATDGTDYTCYGATSSVVTDAFYNNSMGCLTNANYVWAPENSAELVFNLYQVDSSITDSTTCTNAGRCVDRLYSEVSSITNQAACEANLDYTWVPNIYENDMCYAVIDTQDLTTAQNRISLLSNVAITATNTRVVDYYKANVTLINYNHNQIINGNKTFNGTLTFERVTE